ncbi:FAR1-related sequence 5-like protein [Tanacetum coccineum]
MIGVTYIQDDDDILMSGIDKNGDLIHGEEEIEVESGEENEYDSANDLCRSFGYSLIGKTFDSANDAYDFYNEYGLSKGFGIRKSYHNKHSVTKEIYRHVFVCNKEGYKDMNDKRTTENVKRRCIKRTRCNAMIRVKLSNDEKWVVEKFIDEHNHPFDLLSHVPRQWSHKSFHRSKECKDLVTLLSKEGIRPSEIAKIVNAYRGNHEDKLTRVQCSTIVSGERRRNLGKECHGVIMHFKERAEVDKDFYFAMDLSTDGTLRNVFWADAVTQSEQDIIASDPVNRVKTKGRPKAATRIKFSKNIALDSEIIEWDSSPRLLASALDTLLLGTLFIVAVLIVKLVPLVPSDYE